MAVDSWSEGFLEEGFMAKLPSAAYDESGNFQYLQSDTGPIGFGIPVYTFGKQPNPYSVPKYTEILIDPACLTGSGATTQGIKMRSDLVNWRFADAGQILYANSGSIATPLVSGVAAGGTTSTEVSMWGSLNPMMIPAFMSVSYTHLTLPTKPMMCRSRWSPDH